MGVSVVIVTVFILFYFPLFYLCSTVHISSSFPPPALSFAHSVLFVHAAAFASWIIFMKVSFIFFYYNVLSECLNDVRGLFSIFFAFSMKGMRIGIAQNTFKYTPFNKIDENLPSEATTTDEKNWNIGNSTNNRACKKQHQQWREVLRMQTQSRHITFAALKCHLLLYALHSLEMYKNANTSMLLLSSSCCFCWCCCC